MAVDWWSLGMLVYEMLTGLPPWYTKDRTKLFSSIMSARVRCVDAVIHALLPTVIKFLPTFFTDSLRIFRHLHGR